MPHLYIHTLLHLGMFATLPIAYPIVLLKEHQPMTYQPTTYQEMTALLVMICQEAVKSYQLVAIPALILLIPLILQTRRHLEEEVSLCSLPLLHLEEPHPRLHHLWMSRVLERGRLGPLVLRLAEMEFKLVSTSLQLPHKV